MFRWFISLVALCTSCSFNFELTSQRTALENQILGTYRPLDKGLVTVSAVKLEEGGRGVTAAPVISHQNADLNRKFNEDDLKYLKDAQIIGESNQGQVVILPLDIGLVRDATKSDIKLAQVVVLEENRDRQVILKNILLSGDGSEEDFIIQLRSSSSPGHWLQRESGEWEQKIVDPLSN